MDLIRPLRQPIASAVFIVCGAAVLGSLLAESAHAASATATVPIVMNVNSPVCTVYNDHSSVILPTASSPSMTLAQYYAANGITTASLFGAGRVTSSAFNQTASISCTIDTLILSFVVKPSASATIAPMGAAVQYLVDAAATPQKAFGSAFNVTAEQVSVNGTAAPHHYGYSTVTPYTTPFLIRTSWEEIGQVVWRPDFAVTSSNAIGMPTGGYQGSFDIVVNY